MRTDILTCYKTSLKSLKTHFILCFSTKETRLLTATYFLVWYYCSLFASFFVLDTSAERSLMYAGAPVLAYFLIAHGQKYWNRSFINIVFWAACGYFLINYASIVWSDPETNEKLFQRMKMLVFFPLILGPFMLLCRAHQNFWLYCVSTYAITAVVSGAALLICNAESIWNLERLSGWGRASNPVQCGLLYGIASLLIIFCHKKLPIFRNFNLWICWVAALIPLLDLIFSKSRGPLMAYLLVLATIYVLKTKNLKEFLRNATLILVICGTIAVSFFSLNYGYIKDRGTTGRTEIWAHALDLTREAPIFGHGIATKIFYPYKLNGQKAEAGHPHSIYLSALVHTGLVGLFFEILAIFAGLLAAFRYFKTNNEPSAFIFLLSGALIGLIDYGGYYTNLGTTWVIFWFPIVYTIAITSVMNKKESMLANSQTTDSNP